MSQGFARFDNTIIPPHDILEFEPIRQFGRTEAKFVMLACTGFMFRHAAPGDAGLRDHLTVVAGAFESLLREQTTSRQAYGAVERQFQHTVAQFEQSADTQGIPGYERDKRLLRMYSAKIQRRAGYARAEQAQTRS